MVADLVRRAVAGILAQLRGFLKMRRDNRNGEKMIPAVAPEDDHTW